MDNQHIIIEPSNHAHWYALVKEAHEQSAYTYNDAMENYLVLTLKKFMTENTLSQETIALRMLESLSEQDSEPDLFRTVGDECLVISGLFPERALKRHVSLDYYINTGQAAYQHYSTEPKHHCNDPQLFLALSEHFIGLMDILHLLRKTPH